MQTIKTYRKVGAFYIAWESLLSTPIQKFGLKSDCVCLCTEAYLGYLRHNEADN
jgi:hypothetical protein